MKYPEPIITEPQKIQDERGFFSEILKTKDSFFAVQINKSCSKKGVIRGFHFQRKYPQSKLCFVTNGAVLDLMIDLRKESPNFKKVYSVILSAKQSNQVLIPRGFAHAFVSLEDDSELMYVQDELYHQEDQFGINPLDPLFSEHITIVNPIISEKDSKLPLLKDLTDSSFF